MGAGQSDAPTSPIRRRDCSAQANLDRPASAARALGCLRQSNRAPRTGGVEYLDLSRPRRQDLATGTGTAHASTETDGGVHQPLETQSQHQRAYEDEPGVGHQVGVVEAHLNAVDPVRYSTH